MKAGASTFADSKEILLPGNSLPVSLELEPSEFTKRILSIEAGKFGRLVVCLCLSDLDVVKWHGEKAGIVVG
ncbi:TPA: hypothetical protein QDC37_006863 [Burkholderia aenigmatica]|uniref:hypothetical protein n=1 Tax=Burkholderia sp. AU45251 TaxID=3059204 RepID=UPI002656D05C|nr:hypothetical protein [Burkholderia sp. AU45251]HDR9604667.1 hypothetical protein [Burkholderia aenigmatica]MDN7520877.1 hypothetical protein [Burkholderia sp. AU45251]HDR9697806.1 hypothetical protein [Burkholderia aenigmatica]HDR9706261.1 hypothetical protein [Burkholderia aenigmatica]HDR9731028.1 hypothetical protein [Burkholderia aenigmatica]